MGRRWRFRIIWRFPDRRMDLYMRALSLAFSLSIHVFMGLSFLDVSTEATKVDINGRAMAFGIMGGILGTARRPVHWSFFYGGYIDRFRVLNRTRWPKIHRLDV